MFVIGGSCRSINVGTRFCSVFLRHRRPYNVIWNQATTSYVSLSLCLQKQRQQGCARSFFAGSNRKLNATVGLWDGSNHFLNETSVPSRMICLTHRHFLPKKASQHNNTESKSFTSETNYRENQTSTEDGQQFSPGDRLMNLNNMDSRTSPRNRLDVAIVGLPNAGKSQLLNMLTKSTVSAVTRKRHTTREEVMGAITVLPSSVTNDKNERIQTSSQENKDYDTSSHSTLRSSNKSSSKPFDLKCTTPTQVLFLDTPGFLQLSDAKAEGLDRSLRVTAKASMDVVDYTLIVVDSAKRLTTSVKESIIELFLAALHANGRKENSSQDESDFDSDDEDDFGSHSSNEFKGPLYENSDDNGNQNHDKIRILGDIDPPHQPILQSKVAFVLNKVDLIYPKTDLLDIALELGSIAEECIRFYLKHDKAIDDESLVCKQNILDMDDTAPTSSTETSALQKQVDDMFPTFFYVSAKYNDGVDELAQFLVDMATPCHSWEMEPGQASSLPLEKQIEEVIREKLYRCLHKEVPYHIEQENRLIHVVHAKHNINTKSTPTSTSHISNTSETADMSSQEDLRPTIVIHQDLIVRTASHQAIVYGGSKRVTLERIRTTAERDLSQNIFHGCPVNLHLQVRLVKSKNNNSNIDKSGNVILTDINNKQRDRRWSI